MLTVEVQHDPHVTVLRCSGRIVRGDGADALLRAVMSQDKRHLQIDLSGVEIIDAGGLGVLVALERWAKDGNRTIQLMNPSKRVREALETTKLILVLQICSTIQDCDDAAQGVAVGGNGEQRRRGGACSLRVAVVVFVVIIVIFLAVAVVFLFLFVFLLVGLLSKEDIGNRPIRRV